MYFAESRHIFTILLFVAAGSIANRSVADEFMLRGESRPTNIQHIRQKVEIKGVLHLDPHGKGVTEVPLKVTANTDFQQRILAGDHPLRVRHYRQANAELQFGDDSPELIASTLRDARTTVCLTRKNGKDHYFSPLGPLTREELELVDTPTSRVDLIGLLPNRKLRVGETWEHDPEFLARLLNLDTVGVSDVRGELESVEGGIAKLSSSGTVNGAVGGAATEIELKAAYKFQLKSRRVISLTLAFREKREVTQNEPGFDAVTKLAMAETPAPASSELSDKALTNLNLSFDKNADLLRYESKHGGFTMHSDRRWKVLFDQPTSAVFRFVDDGEIVAQANLIRMRRDEAQAAISLEAFSGQASKALAENFGQLIESKQYGSPRGLRVLRVEATGVASEVDMRWVYYHLSNEEGRRLTCVFTCEEDKWEEFGGKESDLVDQLELVALADEDKEPTPARSARNN